MNDSIYKKIKSLPPLDDTIIQIQRICADENSSISDLTKVVEQDPMLTANILRSANSPLYGFSKEITTVARAISLFGTVTIRGFALSSAVKKSFNINLEPYGITSQDFLNISTIQNALMYNWYSKIKPKSLEILSPASFMLEIGKIVLAHELNENDEAEEFNSRLKDIVYPSDLALLESEFLDITNEEVTAKIFEQWNLENELINSIFYSNDPEDAPEHIKEYAKALKVIKTSVNIFNQLDDISIQNTLPLLDEYGFSQDTFLMATAKVKDSL
ncbi:HDOD domain-containing protein [Campylobacter sp. RM9344]|uniref:HDOD domain-containing protein n=1 Tax=Campylobacter californiensis TaxID=1032243 RepID=A0AAW3ZWX2_9BACT|nr:MULTISPECIES: HDOD domain-containing protein [unclassified Campylobacter]MBE2984800.1 HDOD domain-containing protein [Campylobacter sp. RM6883]MBE2986504.1 HDOD domain-containing protein [Campylobacter sp. RM12919]MBE2987704.1 HDOD domain-containing protein [Campylobacter sp. RM12920]MBE2994734.1 HDOD domain-containing protein [Campylobacter sp. RM6913]MBE3022352.1 HDOD domain-containing protein [Campylobacter sp. 7477a]MBE3029600.1 HDOD domain-containing protein [Campylobacter sp. RM9344]